MKRNSIFTTVLFTLILMLSFSNTALAWYFDLENASGTLGDVGDIYTMDVYFQGEDTDYVDLMAHAINFDSSILTYLGANYPTYTRTEGFTTYNLWNGGVVPTGYTLINPDIIYNVNGVINPDHQHEFFPIATEENYMGTIGFEVTEAGAGYTGELAEFMFRDGNGELVNINGETFRKDALAITTNGTSSRISAASAAVPVPGAIWLLGSGMLFLIKRRK